MKKIKSNFQYIAIAALLMAMFVGGLKHDVVFGELSGNAVGGNLVLNIDNKVGTVSGTVRDGDGNPIVGATVTATGQSATTNAAGAYSLYPVAADADTDADLTVTAEYTGFPAASQLIDVQDGLETVGVDFVFGYSASFDPFDGSAVVSATGPVIALARPHVGDQVMTYDALSTVGTTAYIPMLFKNMWNGYDAYFYVQNADTDNADIDVRFFDSTGVEAVACRETITIFPGASRKYSLPDMTCLGDAWVGGATLTSTNGKKITAVGRPHVANGSQKLSYNSFSSGARTMYVPMLFKNMWGGGYDAAMYIQNVDPSVVAEITISFFDNQGNLTCSQTDSIEPLASKGYWIPGKQVCLKNMEEWVGGARIDSSTADIVVVGRPHINDQVLSYNAVPTGSTIIYAPMQFKRAGDGSYSSAFYVQNLADAQASLTFHFYNTDGSEACIESKTVAGKATQGFWIGSDAQFPCVPNGWAGLIMVESTQTIIALGRPNRGTEIMAYNTVTAGSLNAYVPMLFRNFGDSAEYNSGLFVQNVDPNNSTDVDISFYTTTDGYSCRLTATLNPMERKEYWFGPDDGIVCE